MAEQRVNILVGVDKPTPLSARAAWIICVLATAAVLTGVALLITAAPGLLILPEALILGGVLYLTMTIRQRRAIRRWERTVRPNRT